ncbi:MAG: hypothetical protein R2810_03690 [Flavobacteriales bacterium]
MPHRAHKTMSSMEEVERADPAIREDLRRYLSHPSGIRRLTGLVLTVPDSTMGAGNVALLEDLEGVEGARAMAMRSPSSSTGLGRAGSSAERGPELPIR